MKKNHKMAKIQTTIKIKIVLSTKKVELDFYYDLDTTPDIGKFKTPSEISDTSSMKDIEEDYKSSAKYSSSTSERTPPVFKEVTPEQRKQRLLKLMEEINKGGRYYWRKATKKLD